MKMFLYVEIINMATLGTFEVMCDIFHSTGICVNEKCGQI
jgi:hypothetical protein